MVPGEESKKPDDSSSVSSHLSNASLESADFAQEIRDKVQLTM